MKLSTPRLETLVWALIYGGLIAACVGVALVRGGEAYGSAVVVAGAVVAAVGVVLVWIRSRVREP